MPGVRVQICHQRGPGRSDGLHMHLDLAVKKLFSSYTHYKTHNTALFTVIQYNTKYNANLFAELDHDAARAEKRHCLQDVDVGGATL